MNDRLKKLIDLMPTEISMINNTTDIAYLIDKHYHVGERFICLLISKKHEPILFLNALFTAPDTVKTIQFTDDEDPLILLRKELTADKLGVDELCPAKVLLKLIDDYHFTDISETINYVKAIKNSKELAILKEASLRNDAIMEKVKDSIRIGMSEKDLAKIVDDLQSEAPQSGSSFTPITVFGENIADPHGVPSDRILKEGDLVLVDMGGIYKGYCSDMTRTFFTGSNAVMEEIYDIVLEANIKAIEAIEVGKALKDIDKAARDIITEKGYGQYFVHRLGHGVGSEVHEPLDVSSSNDTLIENGMCFSIEPGIYIPGLGGVRIEDLVCIENNQVIVLNHFPKEKLFLDI